MFWEQSDQIIKIFNSKEESQYFYQIFKLKFNAGYESFREEISPNLGFELVKGYCIFPFLSK